MAPPASARPQRPAGGAEGRAPRRGRPPPRGAPPGRREDGAHVEGEDAGDDDHRPAPTSKEESPTARALREAAHDVQNEREATTAKLQAAAADTLGKTHDEDEDEEEEDEEEDKDADNTYENDPFEDTAGSGAPASLREVAQEINGEADGAEEGEPSQDEAADDKDDPRDPEDPEDTRPPMSEEGLKTLLRCAFHGDIRRAETLLKQETADTGVEDLSVNGTDRHGWTPLHWAAARSHPKFCEFLLHRGAHLHAREQTNGWTALHLAAIAVSRDAYEVADLLIANGASRRVLDRWGDIPHEVAPRPSRTKDAGNALELRKLLRPRSHGRRDTQDA